MFACLNISSCFSHPLLWDPQEEEEKAKALAAAKNAKKGSGPVKPPDLDPDGVKLTQVKRIGGQGFRGLAAGSHG